MRSDLEQHLPPEATAFIKAVENSGPLGDCDGSFYCEIDADICENLCQLLIKHFEKKPSSEPGT